MKRIHVIGRKNSGKTTLVVELVTELTRLGYRVGTIKHTHHNHELDTPGKDSHSHREAGSAAVGILSKGMNAIFWPQTQEKDSGHESEIDKYGQFDHLMNQCDIVLVEGDSRATAAKIEVYRTQNENSSIGTQPMAATDPSVQAIVTDDVLETEIPIWKRSDLDGIVQNIKLLLEQIKA